MCECTYDPEDYASGKYKVLAGSHKMNWQKGTRSTYNKKRHTPLPPPSGTRVSLKLLFQMAAVAILVFGQTWINNNNNTWSRQGTTEHWFEVSLKSLQWFPSLVTNVKVYGQHTTTDEKGIAIGHLCWINNKNIKKLMAKVKKYTCWSLQQINKQMKKLWQINGRKIMLIASTPNDTITHHFIEPLKFHL